MSQIITKPQRVVLRDDYMRDMEERFWEKVDKNGPVHPKLGTPCWLWTGCKIKQGYGRFFARIDNLQRSSLQLAHRVSYILANGPVRSADKNHKILHKCDNPPCVNPDHLKLGTQKENRIECIIKGRDIDRSGENNSSVKLTEEDAEAIKAMYGYKGKNGLSLYALADMFNVHYSTIHKIVKGKTWKKKH